MSNLLMGNFFRHKLKENMRFSTGIIRVLVIALFLSVFFCRQFVYAVDTVPTEEFLRQWEQRKTIPVQTNLIEDWPVGPSIGAEAAILMEADSGIILYSKNINEQLYPASITKMMTALLTVENCSMSEIVTFSDEAIDNTEWGSSRIGIMKGEQLSVEDCLYGLLLGSANEVAYGLAEHVAGDLDSFVNMMNDKAASLGCTNTHFANASGLPDSNHYVSAMDMALIAKAFFSNDTLSMISGTYKYTIPATNKTNETRPQENHHKMIKGKKYEYEGIVGGKTGFTSEARQTLVTCASRDGMKLICVVLKDEAPNQFTDTADLFDYGFDSFKKLKISDYEKRYNISSDNFFHTNIDIMGSTRSLLSLNENGYIIIPKTLDFENVRVEVDYDNKPAKSVARLNYYVGDNSVGYTTVDYADDNKKSFEFANIITEDKDGSYTYEPEEKTVFLTIGKVVRIVLTIIGVLFLITLITAAVFAFIRSAKRAKMKEKKRYKQRSENSRRYNYRKRSENRHKEKPIENDGNATKPGKKYVEPIYKELSKRATSAAESESKNELRDRQDKVYIKESQEEDYYDEDLHEDSYDEDFYDEDFYNEEGIYNDKEFSSEEYFSYSEDGSYNDIDANYGPSYDMNQGYDNPDYSNGVDYSQYNNGPGPQYGYYENQMYEDYPEIKGYGVTLRPLDDPNRWEN